MTGLLIDGCLVITMDPARTMINEGAIFIQGDKIAAVGKSEELRSKYKLESSSYFNARDKVVLPGFVDAHIHLSEHICRSLIPDDSADWMPNWLMPIYSNLTPEDEYFSSLLAFIEMVRTGTTTFCEAGTCLYPEEIALGMRKIGIRGILGRWSSDSPSMPDRLRQSPDRALAAMEDLIRFAARIGDDRVLVWPLVLGMGTASDELMRGAKRLADQHGLGFGFMHASNIPSIESMNTIQSLNHLADLGVLDRNVKITHMVYAGEEDLSLLKKHGVKITHCPTAAMKHCKGLSKYGKFPEMDAVGITISLGADSANGSDHANMLRIIHLAVQIYKDFRMDYSIFPAEKVLEMATLGGAKALLMDGQIGSIEVGKQADLVLFDRNHPEWRPLLNPAGTIAYSVTDRSIDAVFVAGKLILHHGQILGVDEKEVYSRVEDLSRKLMARAGVTPKLKWPLI